MKKILLTIISLLFLNMYSVKAVGMVEEKNTDYFIYDTIAQEIKDLKIYKSANEVFYSLGYYDKPLNNLSFGYSIILKDVLDITEYEVNKIRNIIYFGYGYDDHDDFIYYLVTQYILFEELNLGYIIIDKNNNDLKTLYADYFDNMYKIINDFYILPSFFDKAIDLNYKEEYLLIDRNNVMDKFNITIQYPGKIKKVNDKIYITSTKPGQINLHVTKKLVHKDNNKIYYDDDIVLINRAGLGAVTSKVAVNIHGLGISIKNVSEDGIPLKNSLIELYNSKDEKVFGVFLDANGSFENKYFPLDNYYIIQKTVEDGYVRILDKIFVDVNDYNNTEVVIVNEKPKAKVKLSLSYMFKNNKYGEANAVFDIYENDKLLVSKKTASNGCLEFSLPFGNYVLKQVTSSMNFPLQNEILFNIKSTNELKFEFLNLLEEKEFVIEEEKDTSIEKDKNKTTEYILVDVPNTGNNINTDALILILFLFLIGDLFYVKKT